MKCTLQKYMALKIHIESTTVNAGVHKNTWGVKCAIALKSGSHILQHNTVEM
jgi:hypothetical protein